MWEMDIHKGRMICVWENVNQGRLICPYTRHEMAGLLIWKQNTNNGCLYCPVGQFGPDSAYLKPR